MAVNYYSLWAEKFQRLFQLGIKLLILIVLGVVIVVVIFVVILVVVVLRRSLPWRLGWGATAGGEWGSTKWRGASTTRRRRWWSPSRRWPISWNIGELFIKTSNTLIQGVSELSLQNFGILFFGSK